MSGSVFDFLFPTVPAEFSSDYTLPESIFRLRDATIESPISALFRQAAVGTVDEQVRLRRAIPFINNSYQPRFVGSFQQRAQGVVLSGCFAMHWFVKIFTIFWLGGVLFIEILTCIGTLMGRATVWWAPLPGLGILALGVGSLKLGQWFARNDVAWLSDLIAQALTEPGKLHSSVPQQPG